MQSNLTPYSELYNLDTPHLFDGSPDPDGRDRNSHKLHLCNIDMSIMWSDSLFYPFDVYITGQN